MIEPTKVYQPAYVSINNEADERTVSLWHVSPTEVVRLTLNWLCQTKSILQLYVNFSVSNNVL